MNILPLKALTSLGLMASLAACTPPVPITQDNSGRAVVTSAQGAAAFVKICFKPSGRTGAVKRAVKQDPNYISDTKPGAPFYTAKHKTRAINVLTLGTNGCSVSFVTGKPSAEGATDAALALFKPVGVKSIGGKKGGGQINLKTAKGMVVVGNAQNISRNAVQIMFIGK